MSKNRLDTKLSLGVTVPSTYNKVAFSLPQLAVRAHNALREVKRLEGIVTARLGHSLSNPGRGFWIDDKGVLIIEEVVNILAKANPRNYAAAVESFFSYAEAKREEWKQDCIFATVGTKAQLIGDGWSDSLPVHIRVDIANKDAHGRELSKTEFDGNVYDLATALSEIVGGGTLTTNSPTAPTRAVITANATPEAATAAAKRLQELSRLVPCFVFAVIN